MIGALKERTVTAVRGRALRAGRVPRRAYAHYFLEAEGIHSRIHLQNFWSTFWPQFTAPAVACIDVYGPDGGRLGQATREVPRFGSAFVELRDLLTELGSHVWEGTVAIDLQPAEEIRQALTQLPEPMKVEVNTPYWMAYYDDDENYMYVHSIEKLAGEVFGTTRFMELMLNRGPYLGERWRSWRLLDLERLSELQIVAINHSPEPGRAALGLYGADDDSPIFERTLEFRPRELHRVRVAGHDLISALASRPQTDRGRIGVDPLLTGNGKPYVLLRYGDGPLSLHHG